MIPRLIQAQIEKALFQGKTLVLYGPRQVGKTTLVKVILGRHPEKSSYVSCDLPETQRLLSAPNLESLRRFVGGNRLIVLDEAQRVEKIGLALKILHENFPDTQFLVTGSSSFELGHAVKEPLTGRKREFLLYPISLAELGGTPPPGTVWRFHLCRNRLVYLHDIFMSWNGQFEPGGILNGVMYW